MIETWVWVTFLSALLFALRDIWTKRLFQKEKVTAQEFAMNEFAIATVIFGALFFTKVVWQDIVAFFPLLLVKSIFLSAAIYTYYRLLKKYDISLVSPLINLSPILLILLSSVFLGESITMMQGLGVGIIILATYVLEVTKEHHEKKQPIKEYFSKIFDKKDTFLFDAIIVIVSFSFIAILDKLIVQRTDAFTNFVSTSFLLLLIITIYRLCVGEHIKKFFAQTRKKPILLLPGFLMSLSSFLIIFAIAMPNTLVSLIVPLRRTATFFSAIFGGILFHEKHLFKKAIAVILMLIGVLLII